MLEPSLTERAEADRSWLKKKLGRRLGDPWICEVLGKWLVEVERYTGKRAWYYGTTVEEIYGRIRQDVESHLRARGMP